jgi:flagella basal body P-ring formation protein FlgA
MRALRPIASGLFVLAAATFSFAAPAAEPFTRERLVAELTRNLAGHFNLEGDLQLELLRPWSPPVETAAVWTVEIDDYPSAPASSMLVRCRLLADGTITAPAVLVLRAALWRDVWVARQPLAHGATFDPSALETRRVDQFREREALPVSAGDRSFSFTRSVSPGAQLTWRDITRRPLVRKGSLVEVSAAEGLLTITMKALAMENGAQGETVTVRNPESRRDFAALVVDENRVQVRF